ncbi:uncharacterized protein LOC122498373 [Leptopilina heterotoma]|uniref:uncharacterized protein LOC122498373 n=1 Tax=Leptopilina heterotoma TaxID=63436 RepID=UPI001CA93626|nr:uncharacterized protein LOC122498373 [Leptopilina heterotoma]
MPRKDKAGFLIQYIVAIVASITSAGYGSMNSWTSPALPFLKSGKSNLSLNNEEITWIAPLLPIGIIIGNLLNPIFIDRLGRKWTLLLFALPQISSWLLILLAKDTKTICYGRILGGIGYGGGICATIIYLSEIGTSKNRGIFLTLIKVSSSFGIFFTIFLGAISSYFNMNLCLLLMSILFVILFPFMPDSSYFYKKNHRHSEEKKMMHYSLLQLNDEVNGKKCQSKPTNFMILSEKIFSQGEKNCFLGGNLKEDYEEGYKEIYKENFKEDIKEVYKEDLKEDYKEDYKNKEEYKKNFKEDNNKRNNRDKEDNETFCKQDDEKSCKTEDNQRFNKKEDNKFFKNEDNEGTSKKEVSVIIPKNKNNTKIFENEDKKPILKEENSQKSAENEDNKFYEKEEYKKLTKKQEYQSKQVSRKITKKEDNEEHLKKEDYRNSLKKEDNERFLKKEDCQLFDKKEINRKFHKTEDSRFFKREDREKITIEKEDYQKFVLKEKNKFSEDEEEYQKSNKKVKKEDSQSKKEDNEEFFKNEDNESSCKSEDRKRIYKKEDNEKNAKTEDNKIFKKENNEKIPKIEDFQKSAKIEDKFFKYENSNEKVDNKVKNEEDNELKKEDNERFPKKENIEDFFKIEDNGNLCKKEGNKENSRKEEYQKFIQKEENYETAKKEDTNKFSTNEENANELKKADSQKSGIKEERNERISIKEDNKFSQNENNKKSTEKEESTFQKKEEKKIYQNKNTHDKNITEKSKCIFSIENLENSKKWKNSNFWQLLSVRSNLRGLFIIFTVTTLDCLSGHPVLIYFSQEILTYDGSLLSANNGALIFATIKFLASMIATQLIERFKRKTILLVTGILTAIMQGILAIFFYLKINGQLNISSILGLLPYFAFLIFEMASTIGASNLYYIYQGEFFSNNVKGLAVTVAKIYHMFVIFLTILVYQFLVKNFSNYVIFAIFCICCVIFTCLCIYIIPETKGKSLEEIQIILRPSITSAGYGSIMSWTSPALTYLKSTKSEIPITKEQTSLIAPLLPIGLIIGNFLNPIFINRIGRKWTLMLFALPQIISWLIIYFTKNYNDIYIARIMGGIGYGGGVCAVTVYLSEIGTPKNRGIFLTMVKFSLSLGIFFTLLLGATVNYNYMNLGHLIMPIIFLLIFFFLPDSSYFLEKNQNSITNDNSSSIIEKTCHENEILLNDNNSQLLQNNCSIVQKQEKENNFPNDNNFFHKNHDRDQKDNFLLKENFTKNTNLEVKKTLISNLKESNCWKMFTTRNNIRALTIIVCIVAQDSLSGHMTLTYFSEQMLSYKGSLLTAKQGALFLSLMKLFSCIVATQVIERLKRRTLYFTTGILSSLSQGIIGIFFLMEEKKFNVTSFSFIPFVGLIIYEFSVSMGTSNLFYVLQGELFTNDVKGLAVTFAKNMYMVFGFISIIMYQVLIENFSAYVLFFIFCICGTILCFVTVFLLPETKGKSIEEIQILLKKC